MSVVDIQTQGITKVADEIKKMSDMASDLQAMISRFDTGASVDIGEGVEVYKRAHLLWVKRVDTMVNGGEIIARDQLVSHLKCKLGQWYYSLGSDQLGHLREFSDIETPHARLHELAALSVAAMEKHDLVGAHKCLNEMRTISVVIVSLLDQLHEAVTRETARKRAA